jgi:queuine tRNA-ribosyltransferase
MPVGTQGAVKTVGSEDLEALGFEMILANTYHLTLRPGEELVAKMGGLNRLMSWPRPILTDSGGYQVMSLSKKRKISDAGVAFQSHIDGRLIELTPERSIEIQAKLGVDISMALDECPPYPAPESDVRKAMERTHLWAARSLAAASEGQAAFGIVQGGVIEEFRWESASVVTAMGFDGFAIGGVSVGEPSELQYPVVRFTAPLLPDDKPKYLMGVGRPKDIIHAASCGIDLFDCVLPTRMARHHGLYTLRGVIDPTNREWEDREGPHDPESVFPATERYSAAYLRHLFKAGEPLAARIATLHNLAFYARLMQDIRSAISNASWAALEDKYEDA